jgi:hypothetical protein
MDAVTGSTWLAKIRPVEAFYSTKPYRGRYMDEILQRPENACFSVTVLQVYARSGQEAVEASKNKS